MTHAKTLRDFIALTWPRPEERTFPWLVLQALDEQEAAYLETLKLLNEANERRAALVHELAGARGALTLMSKAVSDDESTAIIEKSALQALCVTDYDIARCQTRGELAAMIVNKAVGLNRALVDAHDRNAQEQDEHSAERAKMQTTIDDLGNLLCRADINICALLNGERDSEQIEAWITDSRTAILATENHEKDPK
jgi:hypothetical protein